MRSYLMEGRFVAMKDQNCAYCMKGDLVAKFGYPVCEMETGFLYLFKEQSKRGRVILAYKDHVSEMTDISDEERNAFFREVSFVSRAIHKVFNPDKVNYGAYGDTGCHLHMHIVPKYKDGDEWGGTFLMNPDKVYLTEEEYEEMAFSIRKALEG